MPENKEDHPLPLARLEGWEKDHNRLKTLWVVSVMAFWGTLVIMGVVYVMQERLDLTLMSVALGTMVLGVVLKARVQLHARKKPDTE